MREYLEKIEKERLAPYAVKSADSRGRRYPESKHSYRTEFQRDRDRIVHSTAFRRLQYKTQVFVNHEGDHYRTRLTHTVEVAIISRSVARALRLNEDLTEAIALAHDLGHTPFGHAGEEALNEIMADKGGFEHNRQCLRVIDFIESRYPDFPGLNLTYELREGILKHHVNYDLPSVPSDLRTGYGPSLESQVVNIADEIAYNCHDVDDGLSSGILSEVRFNELSLWKKEIARFLNKYPSADSRMRRHYMVRFLINYLVSDLVSQSAELIADDAPSSADDIRENRKCLIKFSGNVTGENRQLRDFLYENLYKNERLIRMAEDAKKKLRGLYSFYDRNPQWLPPNVLAGAGDNPISITVTDYIAGMTDRFAAAEYHRLIGFPSD